MMHTVTSLLSAFATVSVTCHMHDLGIISDETTFNMKVVAGNANKRWKALGIAYNAVNIMTDLGGRAQGGGN